MPRRARAIVGGLVYHVLNRANGRVARAEQWRFGGLSRRLRGGPAAKLLVRWPVPLPRERASHVNAAQTEAEVEAIRRCITRGTPFGDDAWRDARVAELCLESTLRSLGRLRKVRA